MRAEAPGTLVAALDAAARRWPDRIAWTFDPGERFTFAEVAGLVAGYARVLRERGVQARLAELDGAVYDAVSGEWSPAPGR